MNETRKLEKKRKAGRFDRESVYRRKQNILLMVALPVLKVSHPVSEVEKKKKIKGL